MHLFRKVANAIFSKRVLTVVIHSTEGESLFRVFVDVCNKLIFGKSPVIAVISYNGYTVAAGKNFKGLFGL